MVNDLRYAARGFLRAPGFTAVVVLTLALGIGANTAVFSLVRAVFLNPLPFPGADDLVMVWERRGSSRDAKLPVSGHEYVAWREHNRVLDRIAVFHGQGAHLTGVGEPEAVAVFRVSADYFPLLGVQAALGRIFADGEDRAGPGGVAVLSDELWRRRFGGDAGIIGERLAINDESFRIIGVLPRLPRSLSSDVWLPLDVQAQARTVGRHNLNVVARLDQGITLQQAQADLERVAATLATQLPRENTDHGVVVVPLREDLVGEFRTALLALLAAVGFVLLIACANVANLLLTRSSRRQREFVVRAALGASRARIARQLLTESLLLAVLGGAAGLLLSAWLMDLIAGVTVLSIPLVETARLDRAALSVTAGLTLLTGLIAGLAPALRASRPHGGVLHEGNRLSDDRERWRVRSILVACEVALALVLLVGAGLMINSFLRLTAVPPGFTTGRTLVFAVDLPASRYAEADERRAFFDGLLNRLGSHPGVEAVGATSHLPLGGSDNWMAFTIAGRLEPPPAQGPTAAFRVVTTDYFRALGVALRRGRFFRDSDARLSVPLIRWFPQQPQPPGFSRPQPSPVAIVSDEAARRFWPGEDPIGKRIRVLFSPEVTIVGVVGDVKHTALGAPAAPHIYLPHNQEPWGSASVVLRASGAPLALAPVIREAVRTLDVALPVTIRTMDDVLSASVGRPRFYTVLVGLFGAVALALSVLGIFGVVGYVASQRTREIGVRLALGARPREIVRMVVREGMRPVAAGVAAGTAGALALTRFIEKLLYGIEPGDPLTFAIVVGGLAGVALLACWLPARRASRLDPVAALRAE